MSLIKEIILTLVAISMILLSIQLLSALEKDQSITEIPPLSQTNIQNPRNRSGDLPHIILITIDALRADHMGLYGYGRDTTPFLDSFAKESIVFENAITPRPKTNPSIASMFSAVYPYKHGVRKVFDTFPPDYSLMGPLKEIGYIRAAFVSNAVLSKNNSAFNSSFDYYDDQYTRPELLRANIWERNAQETTDAALEWIDANNPEKMFLWIHYIDPHGPYYPPEEYRGRFTSNFSKPLDMNLTSPYQLINQSFLNATHIDAQYLIDQYDNEIYYTDLQLRRLFENLGVSGYLENALVIITSDHGESLGQHGYYFDHGRYYYEDCARLPLMVRLPAAAGVVPRRVNELVSNMDVLPSIYEYLGVDMVEYPNLDGKSFIGLIDNGIEYRDHIYGEKYHDGPLDYFALRTQDHKMISYKNGTTECFNLSDDPFELNGSGCEDARENELGWMLDPFIIEADRDWVGGRDLSTGKVPTEHLKALGYLPYD